MPDPAPVVVRHREDADLDGCVALLRQVHVLDRYPVRWPADPVGFLTPPDGLVAWVATTEGAVVGHVMLARLPSRVAELAAVDGRRAEDLLLLRQLFVSEQARGRGLGARLLDVATADATARGCRTVLEVLSLNTDAIGLYARAGWTAVGTTTPAWAPDGTHALIYLAPSRE
jgi:GNAT superfamily N-acetyltransferase